MSIETVRLSERAKTQLITMKRRTGIQQWNILCRWAFCLSLAEPSVPPSEEIVTDSNVEMNWRTFTGPREAVFASLLRHRCLKDGRNPQDGHDLALTLRMHIHRGISYLLSSTTLQETLETTHAHPISTQSLLNAEQMKHPM